MDDFDYWIFVLKGIFSTVLMVAIGTAIVSAGEPFGIVFFVGALLATIITVVGIVTATNESKENEDTK